MGDPVFRAAAKLELEGPVTWISMHTRPKWGAVDERLDYFVPNPLTLWKPQLPRRYCMCKQGRIGYVF